MEKSKRRDEGIGMESKQGKDLGDSKERRVLLGPLIMRVQIDNKMKA